MLDKDIELDIPCQNCGEDFFRLSIYEIESNPSAMCTSCGIVNHFDSTKLTERLRDAENEIDRQLKNLFE